MAVLQQQIRGLQDAVLANLPTAEVRVERRFENIAGFSAEVTAAGLEALRADPRIVTLAPDPLHRPHLAQGIPLIRATTYRSTYAGAGMSIAICDTGVDYHHPQLGGGGFPNSKVIGGFDTGDGDGDPYPNTEPNAAHGTACAGIAAGNPASVGDYIGGVAYDAKIYALKITAAGDENGAQLSAIIQAWDWCVSHQNDTPSNPIMVISHSFGGGAFPGPCDNVNYLWSQAASNAAAAGITVLASSGNEGYCASISMPACLSSVISVGAVFDEAFGRFSSCTLSPSSCAPKGAACTANGATAYLTLDQSAADKVCSYANVGPHLTLLAPGNQAYTLDVSGTGGYRPGNYADSFGGTSAACPYAAGAVACLQSAAQVLRRSFLSPQEVRERLVASGDGITDPKYPVTKPRINLERALRELGAPALISLASASLAGGNGNQAVEPGECNDLWVVLRSDGNTATNLTATVSSLTPGITVVQGNSPYPLIAPGATAPNLAPFRIRAATSFACNTPVDLLLSVSHVGGATNIPVRFQGLGFGVVATPGVSMVRGVTDIGNHGDDVVTPISLPFAFPLVGQAFTTATVSANGNLQFTSASPAYDNTCLPYGGFGSTIMPFWLDLDTSGPGNGIFTSTTGTTPNRLFNVEWRAQLVSSFQPVNFVLRLYEGQSRFDIIYGNLSGLTGVATVGLQDGMGNFSQFECQGSGLSNGLRLAFSSSCTAPPAACPAPVITMHPQSQVVNVGSDAVFSVAADGAPPLGYQWQLGGTNLPGATSDLLTVAGAGIAQQGSYRVIVSNSQGSVTSSVATLTVASGLVDLSFNATVGPQGAVSSVALQSDGKVLVGGTFGIAAGQVRRGAARFNADGSFDASFNPQLQTGASILAMTLHTGGKVVVGGDFGVLNSPLVRLARLTPVGEPDLGFLAGSGPTATVYCLATNPVDGKILVGGAFDEVNPAGGALRYRLARLNPDGSVDASFDPEFSVNGFVHAIALQPNGKILIGGEITDINGTTRRNLARLNADATLDAAFDPSPGFNARVRTVAVLPNGQILVGGDFTTAAGIARRGLARMNSNGTLDTGFNASLNGNVHAVVVQADGKLLIGGSFGTVNGVVRPHLARLEIQGALDPSLDAGTGPNGTVRSMALSSGGRIVIGGEFTAVNGLLRPYVARLLPGNPPQITSQPRATNILSGQAASFTVGISSLAPATYQWQWNGNNLSGATSPTLNLVNVAAGQQGEYRVVVSSTFGSVASIPAVLTVAVPGPPLITGQPQSRTNLTGSTATFEVAASGTPPLSYQWRWNGLPLVDNGTSIRGSASARLDLQPVALRHAGAYDVLISSPGGSATSAVAILSVQCPPLFVSGLVPDGAVHQPYPGGSVTTTGGSQPISITASGAPPGLTWAADTLGKAHLTGIPISGGVFVHTLTAVDAFDCSGTLTLTQTIACPGISLSPSNLPAATVGSNYSVSITALEDGAPSVTFGFHLAPGTIPPGLSLSTNGQLAGLPTTAGRFEFTVVARGSDACTQTHPYTLQVNPPPPPAILLPPVITNGEFRVTFSGVPGAAYRIETLTGFATGWQFHTDVTASPSGDIPFSTAITGATMRLIKVVPSQ